MSVALSACAKTHFQKQEYELALTEYLKAIEAFQEEHATRTQGTASRETIKKLGKIPCEIYIENQSESEKSASEQLSVLFCNAASCYLRLNHWKNAIDICSKAIEIRPRWEKPYKKRSEAFQLLVQLIDSKAFPENLSEVESDRKSANIILGGPDTKTERYQFKVFTLNKALAVANKYEPCAKIFVEHGVYEIGVVCIECPVYISGASRDECILHGVLEYAVSNAGITSTMSRLTLKLSKKYHSSHLFTFHGGRLDITDCLILGLSKCPALIEVHKDNTFHPESCLCVEYCVLRSSKEAGIFVIEGGTFKISKSFIEKQKLSAVEVRDKGSEAEIRHCEVRDTCFAINIWDYSSALVTGCYIHDLGYEHHAMIELDKQATAHICSNFITSVKGSFTNLLQVCSVDSCFIHSNIFAHNKDIDDIIPITFTGSGNMMFKHNAVYDNNGGIICLENTSVVMEENEIYDCKLPPDRLIMPNCGILVFQSQPMITKNIIRNNVNGVVILVNSRGSVRWNRIKDNSKFGIKVGINCCPVIDCNTYENNGGNHIGSLFDGQHWYINDDHGEKTLASQILRKTKASPGSAVAICDGCKKEVPRKQLKQCSRCRRASYCSKECQKVSWKVHKLDCFERCEDEIEARKFEQRCIRDMINKKQRLLEDSFFNIVQLFE